MDNIIFNGIYEYYQALSKLGYYKYDTAYKLLVLCFYRYFLFHDYHGIVSRADYHEIERALNCLFGTDCLIPYPDYLKMGKLHIGEVSELVYRMTALENQKVLKAGDPQVMDGDLDSDVIILEEEDES